MSSLLPPLQTSYFIIFCPRECRRWSVPTSSCCFYPSERDSRHITPVTAEHGRFLIDAFPRGQKASFCSSPKNFFKTVNECSILTAFLTAVEVIICFSSLILLLWWTALMDFSYAASTAVSEQTPLGREAIWSVLLSGALCSLVISTWDFPFWA